MTPILHALFHQSRGTSTALRKLYSARQSLFYHSRRALKEPYKLSSYICNFSAQTSMGPNGPREKDLIIDSDQESLYRYTSGRWLWDESAQLSRRYVSFNIAELAGIAAQSIGAASCVEIKKIPEGSFNKTFLLTMSDGREVIAKVPNPNAGRAHFTTASEVATMDFVRNVLKVPAPQVFAWSSRREENPVNAEYIIMEKIPGTELDNLWEDMTGREKYEIVKQLVGFEKSFASTRFRLFGSLYYAQDIPNVADDEILYVNEDGMEIQCSQFSIGPTNNRMFFDEGRGMVDMDRGPWRTTDDYVIATARREIACIMALQEFPRPQGLFYGPGQYRPTSTSKLSALKNYLRVAHYLLPTEKSFRASTIWHSDLHTNNIFVNPEKPTEIVGIIDWQSIHLSPLFLQARHPALIEFNGPIPEGFGRIELPKDFDELNANEQKEAKLLRSAQSLYKLYEVELRQHSEDIFRVLQYRETLACKITALAGSIFSDGEPILNGMLMAVKSEWPNVIERSSHRGHAVPCPLVFSAQEIALQREHEAQWIKGVELMEDVLQQLGAYRGWDGWVNHASYELMQDKLKRCLGNFLDREAENETQRIELMRAWPFADQRTQSTVRRYTPTPSDMYFQS